VDGLGGDLGEEVGGEEDGEGVGWLLGLEAHECEAPFVEAVAGGKGVEVAEGGAAGCTGERWQSV
jgi:hypothetical protein